MILKILNKITNSLFKQSQHEGFIVVTRLFIKKYCCVELLVNYFIVQTIHQLQHSFTK